MFADRKEDLAGLHFKENVNRDHRQGLRVTVPAQWT